ncbi:hypothetical protein BRADI_3g22342v3, partial [Brachypodium distachyon]
SSSEPPPQPSFSFFLLHPISPFPELLHGWLPLSPAAPRRRASPCSLHLPSPPRPSRLSRRRAPPLTPRNHRAAQAPRAPPAPLAGPLRLPCSSATTSPARSASLFPVAELAPHPRLCSGRLAARLPSLPAQLRRRARSVSPSPCCRAPPVHRAARAPCSAPPPRELRRQHPPAALPTSLLCLQRAAAARRVGLAQPGPGPSKPGTPKPKPDPSPGPCSLFLFLLFLKLLNLDVWALLVSLCATVCCRCLLLCCRCSASSRLAAALRRCPRKTTSPWR